MKSAAEVDAKLLERERVLRSPENHEALRESERRFRIMAESMPQKIFTADASGAIEYLNPQWTEFTGLALDAIAGWNWTKLVHPEDVDECCRLWRCSIGSSEPLACERRLRRADGEYRWHVSRAVPIRDDAGRVLMWIGSDTDIHDVKVAEQTLKEADRRKDEFLATLAHELRNPLAPIRNSVELLKQSTDAVSTERARDTIDRQVHQMTRLIDDLVDISRITRNKLELRKERVDLASVMATAVESARPLIDACGHELSITLPETPVELDADATRLAQVFANLLNNAAKYTPAGGRIWISAARFEDEVIVSVRDTGVGLAIDTVAEVFEPFFQIESSLARSHGGLGIGLALTRRLVEMHGGSVEARSAGVGRGSEFVVRLPVQDASCAAAHEADADPTSPACNGARRLLVVDDNKDSADSLALLLRMNGHEVRTAHDGLEAVEVALSFRPAAVVLDIGLPKLNGYDAARRIRQDRVGNEMSLVALTGWGQEQDKTRALEAGFDAHLTKPVEITALLRLLDSLQREQAARAAKRK